jgi:hypothetical protein
VEAIEERRFIFFHKKFLNKEFVIQGSSLEELIP